MRTRRAILLSLSLSAVTPLSLATPPSIGSADPLIAIDRNRTTIIADIVNGFRDQVKADELAELTKQLSKLRADQLLAASLTSSLGALKSVLNGPLSPPDLPASQMQKVLGDPTHDLVYTPLSPCRMIDTRGNGAPFQGGAFAPFERRNFSPNGLCGIPTTGVNSLTIGLTTQNLTPNSGGYVSIVASGAPIQTSLDIFNFGSSYSQTNAVIPTGQAGDFDVFVHTANAQIVVDVLGYFSPAPSRPLVSTVTRQTTNSTGVGSSSCLSAEIAVGGGCFCTGSHSAGTNFGVVFACEPSGQSYVGGCYDYVYSSAYGPSPITTYAICLSGITFIKRDSGETEALETEVSRLREQRNEISKSQN